MYVNAPSILLLVILFANNSLATGTYYGEVGKSLENLPIISALMTNSMDDVMAEFENAIESNENPEKLIPYMISLARKHALNKDYDQGLTILKRLLPLMNKYWGTVQIDTLTETVYISRQLNATRWNEETQNRLLKLADDAAERLGQDDSVTIFVTNLYSRSQDFLSTNSLISEEEHENLRTSLETIHKTVYSPGLQLLLLHYIKEGLREEILGNYERAREIYLQLDPLLKTMFGEYSEPRMTILVGLADTLNHLKKRDDAAQVFQELYELRIKAFGKIDVDELAVFLSLVKDLMDADKVEEALETLSYLTTLMDSYGVVDFVGKYQIQTLLCDGYMRQENYGAARRVYKDFLLPLGHEIFALSAIHAETSNLILRLLKQAENGNENAKNYLTEVRKKYQETGMTMLWEALLDKDDDDEPEPQVEKIKSEFRAGGRTEL